MSNEKKEFKMSYWAAHLTTIVSVSLVLLMIGIIALVTFAAESETKRLKEQIEFAVVLNDSIPDATADAIHREVAKMPFAASTTLISSKDAIDDWNRQTGSDLEEELGVNPFPPEVSVAIRAEYAAPDSLKAISEKLEVIPGVAEVAIPDASMVEAMNRNISMLSWILAAIAAVMLVISVVLINNTVHLAIYARRFTIHTMKLVGATDAFIRRPFLTDNMLNGVVSGCVASGLIAAALAAAESGGVAEISQLIGWGAFAVIAAGLIMLGIAICTLAAAIATGRYLRADYDDLFR